MNYYYLDWLCVVLNVVAYICLGNKNKTGFILTAIANLLWIIIAYFIMKSIATCLGNSLFLLLNIRAFLKWNKNYE